MASVTTKICGITRVEDAMNCVDSGADVMGLNFYEKGKRFISPAAARSIVDSVAGKISAAGVFVNATQDQIVDIANTVGLDFVQLHGDEQPNFGTDIKKALPDVQLIRAVRIQDNNWDQGIAEAGQWRDCGADIILLDAASSHAYGGTGKTLPWQVLAELSFPRPLWLAGGLTPENVVQAIESCQPDGVDTASGVESAPRVKDHQRVQEFVARAKSEL